MKSRDLPTLIAKRPLRLTKILQLFFFNRKQKYVKQHHRAYRNEIWNMGYRNLEAEYQIAKRLFLKGKHLRLFFSPTRGRIHWIANRIIREHFGLRLQVSVECQLKKTKQKTTKNPPCLAVIYYQYLLQVISGTATHLLCGSCCWKQRWLFIWIILKILLNQAEPWFQTLLVFALK